MAGSGHKLFTCARFTGDQYRRIKLRHVPELRFHYDESVVRGQQLSSLIEEAVASDRSRHEDGDEDAR